jgi:hypothetical protein
MPGNSAEVNFRQRLRLYSRPMVFPPFSAPNSHSEVGRASEVCRPGIPQAPPERVGGASELPRGKSRQRRVWQAGSLGYLEDIASGKAYYSGWSLDEAGP